MLLSILLAAVFGVSCCFSLISAEEMLKGKIGNRLGGFLVAFVIGTGSAAASLAYLFAHAAK